MHPSVFHPQGELLQCFILKVAMQVANHLADEYEYELIDDLWRLTSAQLAAVEDALKLKPGSADKLKEAVKAAQVQHSFKILIACHFYYRHSLHRTSARHHHLHCRHHRQLTANKCLYLNFSVDECRQL